MAASSPRREKLRILATSDVHMHVLSHDYFSDGPTPGLGLSALFETIKNLRNTAKAEQPERRCLLVDNGDMLQGTPLGDHLARQKIDHTPHPLASALNRLGYDAMGVGNHDLDYGIAYLAHFARSLRAPLVSSNLHIKDLRNWLCPHALLSCGDITVGVISVLPPKTEEWSFAVTGGALQVSEMLPAIARAAAAARAEGADIVLALAHTGVGTNPQENALQDIAQSGQVDALVGGHTHLVFPGEDHQGLAGADMKRGKLHDVPTVMPGFGAALVGCVDLDLTQDPTGAWHVENSSAWVAPARQSGQPHAPELDVLNPAHQATCKDLGRVLGQTPVALNSYFSQVAPNAMLALMAAAQSNAIQEAALDTPFADLPILSAVSPPRAGGRAGPWNYTDIQAGELQARHVAEMFAFANVVWAVELNGAELTDWLEKSASCFHQSKDCTDTPLVDTGFPFFDFDVIYGLSYEIDISQPARYDASGIEINPNARRICQLAFQGKPVAPEARFLIAVNNYRACGGGAFPGLTPQRPVLRPNASSNEVMTRFLKQGAGPLPHCPWRFSKGAQDMFVWLDTGPGAVAHLQDIAHLSPSTPQLQSSGFVRIGLTL